MAEEVDMDVIIDGEAREGEGRESDGTCEENPPESFLSFVGSSSATGPSHLRDSKRGRYAEEQEEHVSSGSGATDALSEMIIPVGQASKKYDSRHRHQFVAHQPRIAGGRSSEFRHCDIAGHEHSQCCACHRGEDHDLYHDGDSCHDNRLHVVRTVSVKKAAPAGTVEGRQAASSSSKGQPLLLSTAPGGAMDRLQQATVAASVWVGGRSDPESSDWAPSSRHPNSSYSAEKRNRFGKTSSERHRRTPRRSREKTKKVEIDSDRNYESSVVEDPRYSSPETTYPRGILRKSYKHEPPSEKPRGANDVPSDKLRGFVGMALGSTYSSQLPQTSLSSIARARSRETLDELRSYRRVSELPYAAECSICQTKDDQVLAQLPSLDFKKRDQELEGVEQARDKQEAGIVQSVDTIRKSFPEAVKNLLQKREAATAELTKGPDDNRIRQVPSFQGSVDETLDIPLFTKFHFPTTREEKKISVAAAGKKRESELVESQLRRELQAAQEKLREAQQQDQQAMDPTIDSFTRDHPDKSQAGQNFGDLQAECDYLRKELKHMKKHLDILKRQNELSSDLSVCSSDNLVDSSRLESAQKLVADRSTLEESHKRLLRSEGSHDKHEADLQTKLIAMQDRDAKLLKKVRNVQENEIQEPNVLYPHNGQEELMRKTNQFHMRTKQLESQMEYESQSAAQDHCQVLQKQVETLNSELEKQRELTQQWKEDSSSKEHNLISKDQKLSEMEKDLHSKERDIQVHRESLSSRDHILSTLEIEHRQSRQSLQAKELRLSELEKALQQAQEELESRELVVSGLEKDLQEHREHLSSKELIAMNLDKDLQQHRQSLLVRDQTIVEMEKTFQVHRQSVIQTEENAQNLQKVLEQTHVQLHAALEKNDDLEKQMNDVAERDTIRLDEVITELDVTKEKLNDVLVQLEAKTVEENHYRTKSVEDLLEAQEQTRAALALLDAKAEEESRLRRKSVQDLQESQERSRVLQTQLEEEKKLRSNSTQDLQETEEKVRALQTQLDAKIEQEKNLRSKLAQDLQEGNKKLRALQAQLDSKREEEKNIRIKSAEDLQEAQEQLKALQELQAQTVVNHEEEKNLRRESVQDLQVSQEQLRALLVKLNEKAEEEKKIRAKSAQELQEAQEQLKALKELHGQLELNAEEQKNLKRNAEQDFQQERKQLQSLQVEMKKELQKEQDLRKNSLMELQQTQEQMKEMKDLKAQVEGKAEDEHKLRRKSEQDLEEAQQQLLSEREHMIRKDKEEKHFRRKSMQDLQDTQEKLRTMQHEHRRQSTATIERVNLLLSQQRDLVEQLETVHDEKKQLESDHQQARLELEMIRKAFAGLKITLAKHDLCVDFVEDVEEVLKDLHTMIGDHKDKKHTKREDYLDPPDQEVSSSKFSPKRSSAGIVLRDLHSMTDDQKKQRRRKGEDYKEHSDQGFRKRRSKGEDYTEYSDQGFSNRPSKGEDYTEYSDHGFNSRISKKSSITMGDTSVPRRMKTILWRESSSMGTGTDFTDGTLDGTPKTEASGEEESRDEEDPLNRIELKEELEERLEDVLSTLGVGRNSEKLSDDMYDKLVTRRFQR